MLVVDAGPVLVAGWRPRRLDASHDDSLVVEDPKGVEYRPNRDGPDLGPYGSVGVVLGAVRQTSTKMPAFVAGGLRSLSWAIRAPLWWRCRRQAHSAE
jgi:hypothetical protein